VELKIGHTKLTKFIDRDLFFYIYDKKFISWDFYMANFLISFKDVRETIDNLQGKKKIQHSRMNSRLKIEPENYSGVFSESDNLYSFVMTGGERVNSLYKIIPNELHIAIPHYSIENKFLLNLKQMRIVNQLSQDRLEIESFFRRIAFLSKKDHIILDYDRLDTMTPVLFKCIQKYEKEDKSKLSWSISLG
jgi:hypothetical protein